MYSITKVEAVNRILQGVDGTILANLSDPLNATAIQVVRALDVATDKIQMDNDWNFNSEGPLVLTANNDNRIATPSDWLFLKFLSWTGGSILELSVRSGYIYSSRLGTDAIGGSVTVVGSSRRAYEDLPGPIQNYVIEKAKYEYQALSSHFSGPRAQLASLSMEEAFVAAQKWDAEQRRSAVDYYGNMRDNVRNQSSRGWWWS